MPEYQPTYVELKHRCALVTGTREVDHGLMCVTVTKGYTTNAEDSSGSVQHAECRLGAMNRDGQGSLLR